MTLNGAFDQLARSLSHAGRSLRHPNFRIFFFGQGVSVIGTWMQMTALSWFIYHLGVTGSGTPTGTESWFVALGDWFLHLFRGKNALLGLVMFCGQVPVLLVGPLGGVIADRFPRRSILVATQSLAMFQAFSLAGLFYFHQLTPTPIILLAVTLGVINAFDMPTRHAFVVEMVRTRDDLGSAIALNSFLFNGGRLIGPPLAGFLYAALGVGACFLANALSYLAIIIAFFFMSLPAPRPSGRRTHVFRELFEGVHYAWHFAPVRAILLLLALVSFVGMPYAVLMPYFASEVFHGGPLTLGLLMAFIGIGALCGVFYLATRKSAAGLAERIPLVVAVFGVSLILFAFSKSIFVAMPLLAGAGFGLMVAMTSSNTILQTLVSDDKRGRIMALFTMSFMGTAPFGSLLAGIVSDHIGPPRTVFYAGIIAVVGASVFAVRLPALSRLIRRHLGDAPQTPPI